MSTLKHLFAAAVTTGALSLSSLALLAPHTAAADPGLIGKRHTGLDLTYNHFDRAVLDNARGAAASVNLPLNAKFDASFAYDYARASDGNVRLGHHGLRASLLTYNLTEHGKAYFSGTLGHGWDRLKAAGTTSRDDDSFWSVAAGYEVPLGDRTAFNLGLSYGDTFSSGGSSVLQYRLEGNHWFSPTLAGVAAVSYRQISKAPDALTYTLGLRLAF